MTHIVELRRKDGGLFSPKQAEEVREFLYWMLSFINGARCGCELASGYRFTEYPFWEQWNTYVVDVGSVRTNWFPKRYPAQALSIMDKGWLLWKDKDKRDWLSRAISIYTDCNENTSGTEVELAKAQMGLELLTWVVLREQHNVISEKGLKDLDAVDRLRLLLSWSGVPLKIPVGLVKLTVTFAGANEADGPLAITDIRNCTIHPTKQNLTKLHGYDLHSRFEAWWLSLWYIEMVLLKLFNYNGFYDNRLDLGGWAGASEVVPWVTPAQSLPNSEIDSDIQSLESETVETPIA